MKKSFLHSPSAAGEIVLYDATDGGPTVEVRLERDTVWLSQEQMAALFDVQKAAVSKHLKNILGSGELERAATISKWKQFNRRARAVCCGGLSISTWMRLSVGGAV